MKQKKPYVKPGIVFVDCETGELSGTPEMVEQMKSHASHQADQAAISPCPFESFSCSWRPFLKRDG